MRCAILLLILGLVSIWAQTCPRCTPLCKNGDGSTKVCGDDGCGNSCGTCPFGQECCGGSCICTPNCQGRNCGDDGCGGNSCGICSPSQSCQNGQCVGNAVADCSGRSCGSNRAGGSCGGCQQGQRCREGQCECYYNCNERNCGNAFQPANTNTALCPFRSCGTCPSGFTCGTNGRCAASTPCSVVVTVVDCNTRRSIASTASVFITSTSLSYTSTITVTAGQSYNWTTPGIGAFTFQTSAQGYTQATQNFTLTATTTSVELCLTPAQVQIDVRNLFTNVSIEVGASITYSGVCSGSLRWTGVTTFTHCGFGSYFFLATPDSRYAVGNLTYSITSSTSLIIIYVQPNPIPVRVVDCQTRAQISTAATVTITTSSLSTYSVSLSVAAGGTASWSFAGYYSYTFSTSASQYLSNTESFSVTSSTTDITVCVIPTSVNVDVRLRSTDQSIEVGATVTYSGVISGSFRWNGITVFHHGGYGSYSFVAVPDSKYSNGTTALSISASTTLIIIYVDVKPYCGNFHCDSGETNTNCPADCVAIFFEFENADGSGPVNQPTVNYFLSPPLDANNATGPNRNSIPALTTRTTGNGSNTVLEETYSYNLQVWVEVVVTGFINFYWRANTSHIDPQLGTYRLRVHLSKLLGSTDLNYRFVNTWKPIDATPEPYGPTDLNLHSFHPRGALDINNPNLTSSTGFLIGRSIADSKQSGGPATMDISPGAGEMVAIWNSKPPRSAVIAPSQNGRFLMDSGSYVVFYGKTSNAASGKQLGAVVMDELFLGGQGNADHSSDLWYIAQFTPVSPAVNQPTIVGQGTFKKATITSTKDMIFDCQVYAYCAQFVVPYSDTGR